VEEIVLGAVRCRYRGVAALFNHTCCGANVKVSKVVANNTDARFPIHGFFALKKIVVREVRTDDAAAAAAAAATAAVAVVLVLFLGFEVACFCYYSVAVVVVLDKMNPTIQPE